MPSQKRLIVGILASIFLISTVLCTVLLVSRSSEGQATTPAQKLPLPATSDVSWTLERQRKNSWDRIFDADDLEAKLRESDLDRKPEFWNKTAPKFANVSFREMVQNEDRRRLLATGNVFDSPGIIGFDRQTTSAYEYYAYHFIFSNLALYSSKFVLYPYLFTYTPNESLPDQVENFTRGAVFTIEPDLLPNVSSSYNYFSSVLSKTNVSFGKSKALYDINIAVLSISGYYDDVRKDLIYESTSYCNVLATYMGKFSECLTGDGYLSFKSDSRNTGKTALVMVNETDISTTNLLFTADGSLRFGLLILPDYYLGAHAVITSKLGTAGVAKIKDFISKGGKVFASGKAGYLLEYWGILPAGLYNTKYQLTSTETDMQVQVEGCDNLTDGFDENLVCLNLKGSAGGINSYLLSAFMMNQNKAENITTYLSYVGDQTYLNKSTEDGILSALKKNEQEYLPLALTTSYEKGRIFLANANPVYKTTNVKMFYNFLMLAMSRNVLLDSYVGSDNGMPIPGGEVGVQLDVKMSFINVYNVPVSNVAIHMWFPNNIYAANPPSNCVPDTSIVTQVDLTTVNSSSHLKCFQSSMGAFERMDLLTKVEILDSTVTQAAYEILIVAAVVMYTDQDTGIDYAYDIGGIKTDAALAALLAGGLNVQPTAFYPLLAQGDYMDNEFGVENKEETIAYNVDYVSVVPLISPVTDGSNQKEVSRAVRFFDQYYNNRTPVYYFPFESSTGKNYDYIDYKWLNGKGAVFSADWDTPSKSGKVVRNGSFPDVSPTTTSFDVINGNWSTIVTSMNIVLKQIYYVDADKFFESATQRLLVFLDTSTEGGAAARYPSGIPEDEVNTRLPTTARKELIWTRIDVYFYESDDLVRPYGLNYTHVISVDRYTPSTKDCIKTFGDASSHKIIAGYFGNSYTDGLKSNEYSNELLMYCDRKKISMTEAYKLSNGTVIPIHYLIPVYDEGILYAGDVMGFIQKDDGTGYMEAYPELKFVYAHKFTAGTPKGLGGKLEMVLPSGVKFLGEDSGDPAADGNITYSSNTAFYKTIYDKTSRTITAYFKYGGHTSNVSKPSTVDVVIEGLNTQANVGLTIRAYEVKYDISIPEQNFERYIHISTETKTIPLDRFFSLPAVEIHSKLNRSGDASVYGYEAIEMFSRIGVYTQELLKHRAVYGSAESHHVTAPGVQVISGGMSMVSNLGVCSIPFASLVTHGPGLLIPNAPTTSRVEWDDMWGRRWVSPLRSLFPDIPPVPAPVMDFSMATTFEITKTGTKERALQWNSDEEMDIHVHIKVTNPYPKYFAITACKDNEVPYVEESEAIAISRLRIYDSPPYPFITTSAEVPNKNYQLNFGNRAVYGFCFDNEGTILEGKEVSAETRATISTAYLCAETLDQNALLECAKKFADLPTVHKRTDSTATHWIYSPEVERYYPSNYLSANMWDLTHIYYDDTPMNKAFAYHMDNNLPGLEYGPPGNLARYKPNNILAFAVWKGFGFQIWYDKAKSLKRFPKYRGWWTDNLQNKDHTLYAGQSTSNTISVDKESLLSDSDWIGARDIINFENPALPLNRLKNIHTCLFNQHRVKLAMNHTLGSFISNVYQNNIIPVPADLTEYDARYSNYDCDGVYQYSPYNISQFDSIVRTNDIRDSMLFAANLRAEAHETLHIVMGLKPIAGTKYEGMAKVQDGGSFTYWIPGNGPNSFGTTGSGVSVIEAKRSDLTISCEVFPKTTTTYNPVLYHMLTITDPAEVLREWKYQTYTSNYGFGDAVTAIYVGGARATKAILEPGDSTIIKVTFINNAGFDWNLLGGSVEADELGSKVISAKDIMSHTKHSIQLPTKYNFMVLSIPDAIKDYVNIIPSDYYKDVAPCFFDFLDINLATIGDGASVRFYYNLTLSDSIPDSIRGKVYSIGITLNQTYFDRLPMYNDPTVAGYHDYTLQVPSIKFGIPYGPGSAYPGKIFYTSGYSTNLMVTATLPSYWSAIEARIIDNSFLLELRTAASDGDNYVSLLDTLWGKLPAMGVSVSNVSSGSAYSEVRLNFSGAFPTFPKPNGSEPDIAAFNVLLKAKTSQLSYGTVSVISVPKVYYNDFANKTKSTVIPAPTYKTVTVRGAWIKVSYTYTVVEWNSKKGEYEDASDQRRFKNDNQFTLRVKLTAKNVGTGVAYRVNFTTVISNDITIIESQLASGLPHSITHDSANQYLKMATGIKFAPGTSSSQLLYLSYDASKGARRRLLASGASLTFVNSVSADIDMTETVGAIQVSQTIDTPLTFSLLTRDRDVVALTGTVLTSGTRPAFRLTATATPDKTTSGENIRYIFYAEVVGPACTDGSDAASVCTSIFGSGTRIIRSLSDSCTVDATPIPSSFGGVLTSANFSYYVESYDEKKAWLATSRWTYLYLNDSSGGAVINPTPTPTPTPTPENNATNTTEKMNETNVTEAETSSESGSGNGFPLWAIILIPLLATTVIVVSAVVVLKRFRNNGKVHDFSSSVKVITAADP